MRTRMRGKTRYSHPADIVLDDTTQYPGKLSTEQLRDLVKTNYDRAYDTWWV